jgi:deazaflavin-dependent oxidoreductase (nitroreductase family)
MNTQKRYSLFHRIGQKIAASKPGSWYFSRTQHHLDRLLLKLTGGRRSLTGLLAGLPVVTLTVTGAKSGLPRTVPLLYIRDPETPDRFALIASNYGQRHYPAWYHNLKANPQATCTIRGEARHYTATEGEGDEYQRFWGYAQETYPGFPNYAKWVGDQRHIPIMVMTPMEAN